MTPRAPRVLPPERPPPRAEVPAARSEAEPESRRRTLPLTVTRRSSTSTPLFAQRYDALGARLSRLCAGLGLLRATPRRRTDLYLDRTARRCSGLSAKRRAISKSDQSTGNLRQPRHRMSIPNIPFHSSTELFGRWQLAGPRSRSLTLPTVLCQRPETTTRRPACAFAARRRVSRGPRPGTSEGSPSTDMARALRRGGFRLAGASLLRAPIDNAGVAGPRSTAPCSLSPLTGPVTRRDALSRLS